MRTTPPDRTPTQQPADTWRVCGRPYDADKPGRGCICQVYDPTWRQVHHALTRLNEHHPARDEATPTAPHRGDARKAS